MEQTNALVQKKPVFKRVIPCMMVNDVQKTVNFYEQYLGFEPVQEYVNFATVHKDHVWLEFRKTTQNMRRRAAEFNQNRDIEFLVNEIDVLYEQLKSAQVKIVSPLTINRNGNRGFEIADCNGYILLLSEFEQPII